MSATNTLPIEGLADVEPGPMPGEQHIVRFPNGYGASVLRGPVTPGNGWEVLTFTWDPADRSAGRADAVLPGLSDPFGMVDADMSVDAVADVLLRISRLPAHT